MSERHRGLSCHRRHFGKFGPLIFDHTRNLERSGRQSDIRFMRAPLDF